MLTGLQCSTAETVRANRAICWQGKSTERRLWRMSCSGDSYATGGGWASNQPWSAVLYTAAAVETIWCNNSTHWDVQPTIALSAVLCCRSSESKSDQSRHLTLLGPESRSVRQTNQAISRCCVVDRETLSWCFFFCSLGFSLWWANELQVMM